MIILKKMKRNLKDKIKRNQKENKKKYDRTERFPKLKKEEIDSIIVLRVDLYHLKMVVIFSFTLYLYKIIILKKPPFLK